MVIPVHSYSHASQLTFLQLLPEVFSVLCEGGDGVGVAAVAVVVGDAVAPVVDAVVALLAHACVLLELVEVVVYIQFQSHPLHNIYPLLAPVYALSRHLAPVYALYPLLALVYALFPHLAPVYALYPPPAPAFALEHYPAPAWAHVFAL